MPPPSIMSFRLLQPAANESASDVPIAERERKFAAMVERHSVVLFRVAFSLLRNPQDAEDAKRIAPIELPKPNPSMVIEMTMTEMK